MKRLNELCWFVGLTIVAQVQAYDVNIDLQNAGPQPAFDVAVVLSGTAAVTNHFDGYGDRYFITFSQDTVGSDTVLHWQGLVEPGGDGEIGPGEVVHVGWSTADGSGRIKDMYWTDANGERIPDSQICNLTPTWTYDGVSGTVVLGFENAFVGPWGDGCPLTLADIRAAGFSEPWALEQLNWDNTVLNEALDAFPGGESLSLVPGEYVELTLPFEVPPGQELVLRYQVLAADSHAFSTDWVQLGLTSYLDGACCLSSTCDGIVTADECLLLGGVWYPGEACEGTFGCPGQEVRCTQGDIDGDGEINAFDIDPFVATLAGEISDPDYVCSADTNGDGQLNAFDIDAFVGMLLSANEWFGYEKACDGQNRMFVANPVPGDCYTVRAQRGEEDSDCPVTVEALTAAGTLVGTRLVLEPGEVGEFCVPGPPQWVQPAKLVYRCGQEETSRCRFEWHR